MTKPPRSEEGHTLIEMVIVLLIISITLAIPILSFYSLHEKQTQRHFINLLSEDIRYAQQYAYSNSKRVFFQVRDGRYYVREENLVQEPLIIRKIPEDVRIETMTLHLHEVFFNTRGNIRKPGTFYIRTPSGRYRIVFLVGRGRFYVEEH